MLPHSALLQLVAFGLYLKGKRLVKALCLFRAHIHPKKAVTHAGLLESPARKPFCFNGKLGLSPFRNGNLGHRNLLPGNHRNLPVVYLDSGRKNEACN